MDLLNIWVHGSVIMCRSVMNRNYTAREEIPLMGNINKDSATICSIFTLYLLYHIMINSKDTWHDDVINWKHFRRYWPFGRGNHRSPMDSPHKCQWRGALMFSLIWMNGWVNNRDAGDLRRHCAYYYATVMQNAKSYKTWTVNNHKNADCAFSTLSHSLVWNLGHCRTDNKP